MNSSATFKLRTKEKVVGGWTDTRVQPTCPVHINMLISVVLARALWDIFSQFSGSLPDGFLISLSVSISMV